MRVKSLSAVSLPCARLRYHRRLQRLLPVRPAVNCSGACQGCGWSRAEQARRLRQGRWQRDAKGRLCLHFPPLAPEADEEATAP